MSQTIDTTVTRVAAGAPFTELHEKMRAGGRVGGIVDATEQKAQSLDAMRRALGIGAQLLGDAADAIVADFDACWLDGVRVERADWRRIVCNGRLADVRGSFAIAWREADALCLARDGIGGRTLYVAIRGNRIAFASTLRAVSASGMVERRVDPVAVAMYLSFGYMPGAETLIEGVRELLPGELLRFRGGVVQSERIWSLAAEREDERAVSDVRSARELRALLETAVRRALPADESEPIGATLSGGIDSSLVVALAAKLHRGPVHTYSISFGAEHRNELAHSSLVAEHCGTSHRVLELPAETIARHLDDTMALLSDPIGDPLTIPNALAFREASRDVGVVLNGEGGDPCFGGPKNMPMLLAALLGDGRDGGTMSGHGVDAIGAFARERSFLRAHEKCFDELPELLNASARAVLIDSPLEHFVATHFADTRWRSFVTRLQAINLELKGAHHILHKVDETSFPFGVLSRAPLFDRDVVELAFSLPPTMRLQGAVEKHLLKLAVADLLPRSIVDRPKSGMLVPVEAWFRGPLQREAQSRLLDGLTQWNLFERSYLERLLAGKLPGLRPRHGAKIWLLVTLEAWLRTSA